VTPRIFRAPSEAAVRRLLGAARLPADDLTAAHFAHFFGCGTADAPRGVVGLELHGTDALLRSLAVEPAIQGRGCGTALVARAEQHARRQGVRRLYLLTTGAADFFARLGYKRTERQEAPGAIRLTGEFSMLCPASSVLMMKEIEMASAKQKAAARRNIRKAARQKRH
jgi:amino-acid N-acetyltransferase